MTLAGLNLDDLSFPRMADVCAALLVEVFQAAGDNLIGAIARVQVLGLEGVTAAVTPRPPDNDQSLAVLEAMMAGTR